ncbi:MAG TPA: hypothetical protein DDW34_05165 [Clostridium sp.]|nr:hypothetical protein [Clostridium sp.]
MKKDNIRDYATEAFRYYAACGRKTADECKDKVKEIIYEQSSREIVRSGSGTHSDSTAYRAMEGEDASCEMAAEFLDIIAVEKTLMQLTEHQRAAVEIVYFTDAKKELEKGDISTRVHRAEIEIPASGMSIYRWLKSARYIFAKERGLRIIE